MSILLFFTVFCFFLLFNRNKKIVLYSILFLIASLLLVTFSHIDILSNGFTDGVLGSDDRHFLENYQYIDYLDLENWLFRVKNTGYYFYNYVVAYFSVFNPIYEIKITNTLIFVFSIYIYLNSVRAWSKNSKYFLYSYILILSIYPIFFIISLNYKDSLLYSLVLIQVSLINYYTYNKLNLYKKFFLFVIAAVLILFVETIRTGSFLLLIMSYFITTLLVKRDKSEFINLYKYVFLIMVPFSIFFISFDFILFELLNRSFESYRELFSYRKIVLSGIETLDILVIGFIKSFFQHNPASFISYIAESDFGEHGYKGILYILMGTMSAIIWTLLLFYMFIFRYKAFKETSILIMYVILYTGIYSYLYYGAVGFRIAYPIYLFTILIFVPLLTINKAKL